MPGCQHSAARGLAPGRSAPGSFLGLPLGSILMSLLMIGACSAPALDPDIARGERADHDGRGQEALSAYQAALSRCTGARMSAPRRAACAGAYLARAELLERLDRLPEAALAYQRTPEFCAWDDSASATGLYRAGRLYLQLGQDQLGYRLLWQTITDHPDQLFAGDALHAVMRDGRRRNPAELAQVLGRLFQTLSHTAVADDLLYALAELSEHELADQAAALALRDKLAFDYPDSPLSDDALWHGARVARALGDARGAVSRLQRLLATREVTFGPGSYFSVWLDNAQLELGRVLRDDLSDYPAALAAFALLPNHYRTSTLRDDAMWETALTYDRMGEPTKTCRALARLAKKWPESKYQQEKAPTLAAANHCPPAP
jgi:tetratricopeptide (TPR) repeat protein